MKKFFLLFLTLGLNHAGVHSAGQLFNEDGITTPHTHEFIHDPNFIQAYQRGIEAGGGIYGRWRVKVALWAASHAVKLEGAFVECGVNRGFLTSAILEYLNWNNLDREFYLFDTFSGVDESQVSDKELIRYRNIDSNLYQECYELTKQNFSEFKNIFLIRGIIPQSLADINIASIAYLSIDLNCAAPEVAALEFFWPKLVKGAVVVLDDYAYVGYEPQYEAMNAFAKKKGIEILPLPTGQGLIIKN